jgi:hypothetical protein
VLGDLAGWIAYGFSKVLQLLIDAFGLLVEAAMLLLPQWPEWPDIPEPLAVINWFFPVTAVLAIWTTFVTAYIAYIAIGALARKFLGA